MAENKDAYNEIIKILQECAKEEGVSEELAKLATIHAEIPMRGIKQSLNVSVSTGVAGYEFSRIYSNLRK